MKPVLEESKYFILINMYVGQGYVETGRLYLGEEHDVASELFARLAGNEIQNDNAMLRMDLMAQSGNEVDIALDSRGCTLYEVTENVKLIIKETFRILNLGV